MLANDIDVVIGDEFDNEAALEAYEDMSCTRNRSDACGLSESCGLLLTTIHQQIRFLPE